MCLLIYETTLSFELFFCPCSFSAKDYGLFLADEDIKKGVWLEPGRNLEYYILRNGVS